jgi:hypothetical protein
MAPTGRCTTGGLPVVIDLAFDVSILGDMSPAEKAGQLFYISLESFKRRQIDELWKAKRASSPRSLAGAMVTPTVVDSIRKELRRTTGQNIEAAEITRLLRETVIRPDCLP